MELYECLEELDADKAEMRASRILYGLDFTSAMQRKKLKDFSGDWRMRVALPEPSLFGPSCLHLLSAMVLDFLNGVYTNIIPMHNKRLKYYTGNYDQYVKTWLELGFTGREQDQIAHMKNYIARFGHGSAKLAQQDQSKENDATRHYHFTSHHVARSRHPSLTVQNVSFKHTKDGPCIYNNLEFGIDLDTRVALLGPNRAGKSTLLELLTGELLPTDGMNQKHSHYMMKCYPEIKEKEEMRKIIGRYGLTGKQQVMCLAWLAWQNPHMLFLNKATNHLDIETIDALADAIQDFEGGIMLVSHDFRLIQQVAQEIWVYEKQTITKWPGDILAYKEHLKSKLVDEQPQLTKRTHNV
uniref:ABC transporter domain-containing protein n=1 Tax=Cebus imitator TaxID=2715852 RepID=A0A2K5S3N1_CEBIM